MSENCKQVNNPDPTPSTPADLGWEVVEEEVNINKPSKTTWPELVGLTAEEAEKKIKEEMEGAYTSVVPEDGFITFDFITNRVQLFVDGAGKVVRAPMIG